MPSIPNIGRKKVKLKRSRMMKVRLSANLLGSETVIREAKQRQEMKCSTRKNASFFQEELSAKMTRSAPSSAETPYRNRFRLLTPLLLHKTLYEPQRR